MRLLLVNPAHTSIGSRIPDDQLPPHGLLSIGGPLIDAGYEVSLLDAEIGRLSIDETARRIREIAPDIVLTSHTGSTSAHPTIMTILDALGPDRPHVVYGGVYPTYHWREVLAGCPVVDFVVRGEGEETVVALMDALRDDTPLRRVDGIAFRGGDDVPVATAPARILPDMDAHRIGWELIDHADYSYWGNLRAVVAQFSRGCPHQCTYCGQRGFWTRWRHRNPEAFAAELAWLCREKGVGHVNLADENPTSSRAMWKRFLVAMAAENVPLTISGCARAGDIARDADIMALYREAGIIRLLLGVEHIDDVTLRKIRKGSTSAIDREAIRTLRAHGIISLVTWGVGFDDEGDRDYWRMFRQLRAYDPDQTMSVFATPHRWTPFYRETADREIVETDQRHWDYKHQVLKTRMPPWRVFLWTKLIEAALQLRPRLLWRVLTHPDPDFRHGMRWYTRIGRRVWLSEMAHFLFRDRRSRTGMTVSGFWGAPQDHEEEAMARPPARTAAAATHAGTALDPTPASGR